MMVDKLQAEAEADLAAYLAEQAAWDEQMALEAEEALRDRAASLRAGDVDRS